VLPGTKLLLRGVRVQAGTLLLEPTTVRI